MCKLLSLLPSLCHPLPGYNLLQPDNSGPSRLEDVRRHEEPSGTQVRTGHVGATPTQCHCGAGEGDECSHTHQWVSPPPPALFFLAPPAPPPPPPPCDLHQKSTCRSGQSWNEGSGGHLMERTSAHTWVNYRVPSTTKYCAYQLNLWQQIQLVGGI